MENRCAQTEETGFGLSAHLITARFFMMKEGMNVPSFCKILRGMGLPRSVHRLIRNS